jgi:hypothetical protein
MNHIIQSTPGAAIHALDAIALQDCLGTSGAPARFAAQNYWFSLLLDGRYPGFDLLNGDIERMSNVAFIVFLRGAHIDDDSSLLPAFPSPALLYFLYQIWIIVP